MKGLFYMANNNTLLALAYIRECNNPLQVFCNLILYCLSGAPDQKLRHDELKSKMIDVFGLNIPNHVIDSCARFLLNDRAIKKHQDGSGYELIEQRFDIARFETEKTALELSEKALINDLISFVSTKYSKTWEFDEAREHFSNLVLDERFAKLVIENELSAESKKAYISPTWYVKKYIENLLQKPHGAEYQYFINVFNGVLVLIGLTQTNDYNQDKQQKFKGTRFFFDTKILLRILGFTFPYLKESATELATLITTEYEGEICVYKHVIDEIKHAIDLARIDIEKYGYIKNREFDYYQKETDYSADDFKIAIDSVEERISKELGFTIVDDFDWNDIKSKINCLDTEALLKFVIGRNPDWSKTAISNDTRSILAINIERESDYSVAFGGRKKRPIFVTSNAKLVQDIKEFTKSASQDDSVILPWSTHRLPIITDKYLICRLWLTARNKDQLTLSIAKSALLYQQSDSAFYEKIKSTYRIVKEKHKFNLIDLDYERFEKLQDEIARVSKGELDAIDDIVVATSFEELARRESAKKDEHIETLTKEKDAVKLDFSDLEKDYIIACAEPHINKIPFYNKAIRVTINLLPINAGIIGVIISFVVNLIITQEILSKNQLWSLVPALISAIFIIVDKMVLKESIIEKLSNWYTERCKAKYAAKVKESLNERSKQYSEEIVEYCIAKSAFFNE